MLLLQPCYILNLLLNLRQLWFLCRMKEQLASWLFSFSSWTFWTECLLFSGKQWGGLLINFGSACQWKHWPSPISAPWMCTYMHECCGLRVHEGEHSGPGPQMGHFWNEGSFYYTFAWLKPLFYWAEHCWLGLKLEGGRRRPLWVSGPLGGQCRPGVLVPFHLHGCGWGSSNSVTSICGKRPADDLSFGVAEGIMDLGLGDLSAWPGSQGSHGQVP